MTKRGKKVTYQELARAVSAYARATEKFKDIYLPRMKLIRLAKRLKASKGRK